MTSRKPVLSQLFVLVGMVLAASPLPAADPEKYALLVGVNEYDHAKLPALKYAVADVTELGEVLSKAGFKVTCLSDRAKDSDLVPTKSNVQRSLKVALSQCRKGDTVVVALAGHGLQFDGSKDAYFCPKDARPFADRTDTLVSLNAVYGELDASFAGVKVLFVDACRDDPAAGRGSRGVDADAAPPPPRGVAALFSCSAGQRAFESDDLKHGIFFHHVLEGLGGKAENADHEVTFNALSDYVAKHVKSDVPRLIGSGATQLPHQRGESIGGSPVLIDASSKRRPDSGGKVSPENLMVPDRKSTENAHAEVILLIPQPPVRTSIKLDGKDQPRNEEEKKTGKIVLKTPELASGKTFAYTIEATIEPNNYTKIVRTREVSFKRGDVVTVDLRKRNDAIPDNVLCRWVPTPRVVARDMCKLANVTNNDVVIDPGCGDAPILVTAVEDFKAKKAIGIDIDPKWVKNAEDVIKAANLQDKVTIKEGNALKLGAEDLKDATVVMLYMGNELNIRLRPIFWEHLKPGTRIVSHRFIMGDWKPDSSITVTREGDYGVEDFYLHVWTITGKEKSGDYPKVDPSTLKQ
ncbi:MAG TPA: caspase family protein [Gemmataceae bacterium]|jgi:uncharacterized protein (TIGR03000 family)|nr:caspase family protein [Gemmataceae bacterium]